MMNCMNILVNNYGFEIRKDGSFWWGIGSLVWGRTIECRKIGGDFYKVTFHKWFYNCKGDCEIDETKTVEVFGAEMLTIAFKNHCYS